MSDAMKTVQWYREGVARDILGAAAIWERLGGPYLRDDEGPIRARSRNAVTYATKGNVFAELAKNFGNSKASHVIRPDARWRRGPLIRTTDPSSGFGNPYPTSFVGAQTSYSPVVRIRMTG